MFVVNPYQLKLEQYLDSVQANGNGMEAALVKAASTAIEKQIHEAFNEIREDKFTLRMSNIGRPICQLMAERDGWKRNVPANMVFKMVYGHIIEALTVAVIRAAGINVTEEQGKVTLPITLKDGRIANINGTFDLLLDDEFIYDVKSASSYSYTHKFASYDSLAADDSFGYVAQIWGYAEARGKKAGGWFVIDKTTGDIKVVEVPQDKETYNKHRDAALKVLTDTANAVLLNEPFKRSFTDEPETFQKKLTGNRVLGKSCQFCDHKIKCWPNVKYMAQPASGAKDPRWFWYTHVADPK